MIIIDTREQKNGFIEKYLEGHGIEFMRSKLVVGDYQLYDNPKISVDRKANIQELISNVIHQHIRFRSELIRANKLGVRLIILVQDEHVRNIDDLITWVNPRITKSPNATTGLQLHRILRTMAREYSTEFIFTSKRDYCATLLRLLEVDADE